MKVYNKDKTQELKDYDLNNGYLERDVILHNIPEVQYKEPKGYYKTIREYDNGGKDLEFVITEEGQEYKPAETIEEQIYVYIPYTNNQIIENQIAEIKSKLLNTDYKAIKYAEGLISDEDYAPIKAQRQAWRDEINELEQVL